jgi:hypothetical protein
MKSSILNRVERLENECNFINWLLAQRFIESLKVDELEAYVRYGKLPEPVPTRRSDLDRLDRDRLLKRWQEDTRHYEGRTSDDLQRFREKGLWPEELGKLHYSKRNGCLYVEWRIEEGPEKGCQTE